MEDYWKEHLEYTYKKNIYSSTPRILSTSPSRLHKSPRIPIKNNNIARIYVRSSLYRNPIRNPFSLLPDYWKLHTYPRPITPGALSNYIWVHVYLLPYLLEITSLSSRNYIRIPFYLYTYSLLFTLGSCIIDILNKLNYHRDDTNLSSRWNVCIIMMKLIFHHDDNLISRLRKQWEYVYK